jgi:hypothetical protein
VESTSLWVAAGITGSVAIAGMVLAQRLPVRFRDADATAAVERHET